jgi:hypothetical protein
MTDPAAKDAVLEAAVERALAPYRRLLPEEALERMRSGLREELQRHPVSSLLLRRLTPPPAVMASGDVERDDAGLPTPVKAKSGGGQ